MASLNPFRVSFDRPLGSRERMRARVTATVVSCVAIFLGATSLVALVKVSTEAMGWSDTQPEVRILAGDAEDPSGKSCEEQTWPFIESRCLKRSGSTERSTPKHGLGSQQVALTPGPAANPSASAGKPTEVGTTGAAASDKTDGPAADGSGLDHVASVPMPVPAPERPAAVRPALESDSAQPSQDAKPSISKRERRRAVQRERRLEARRARAEARRERRERIIRRWSEYGSPAPFFGMFADAP